LGISFVGVAEFEFVVREVDRQTLNKIYMIFQDLHVNPEKIM